MAHFFPSNILDNVLKQLELPIFQSNKLNFLQRSQFRNLRSKLELIKCVIDEAEPMAVLFPDIVGKWVRDLNNMLYEINDLLDEVVTRSMPSSGMLRKVGLRLYRLPFDLTVSPKLKSFNKRLESIVNDCYKCNLFVQPAPISSNIGGGTEKPVPRRGIVRYHPDYMKDDGELHMIGRDDDKRKVISMLFNEDATEPVVCITGEVGVGKTTLCCAIYNDKEVESYFDSRLWADFDQRVYDSTEKQKIISLIERKEKTLIVLDGGRPITSTFDEPCWLEFTRLVATSHNGSKILVGYHGKWDDSWYDRHSLINDLSEEHCWSIFENTACALGGDKKQWMIDLGEKIVKKCPRNPALLKAVGTLLYQNDDMALWDYFSRDFDFIGQYHHYIQISQVSRSFPKCEQAMGYLKLFRKYGFAFTTLIDQHAALGFTNLSEQQEFKFFFLSWEIQKEDRWDDTLARKTSDEAEPSYIITWMAKSEAIFLRSSMDIGHGEEVRHIAVDRPSSSSTQQREIRLPHGLINGAVHKIRSLLFLKELCPVRMSVETLDILASKLLNLRVLDLHDLALKALPSSFGNLIHLRYVDLSRNEFKELPKSICKLKNLQTLKLVYCDKLVKLPQGIKSLHHLKHLELNMCLDLTHMPPTIAEMTSLERLDRFVVGPHNGGLRYLKNLNNLGGHLRIELPRRWEKSTEDAEQANLQSKDGLTSLQFKWNGAYSGDDENANNDVLDELEPCTSIDNLSIINFGGTTFPRWITSSGMESHLIRISISHCRGCKTLPLFHKMRKLQFLTLTSMDIEYLQDDINCGSLCIEPSAQDIMFFPSLLGLKIGRMPKLIGWSRDMSELLRFSDILTVEIWDCPHLTLMPPFSKIYDPLILQNVSKKLLQAMDLKEDSSVEIVSITDMVSLPDEFVSKLPRHLKVEDCNEWQMFWANDGEQTPTISSSLSKGFQRLRSLSIENCPAMKYMSSSLRHLTNLGKLDICKCSEKLDCLYEENEDGMPWKAPQSLKQLKISGFEKLVTLPKALQHIPRLNRLKIADCKSLRKCFHLSESNEAEVRPIEKLMKLSIVNCPELKYLSSCLRHLVWLMTLKISKCSEELDCLFKEDEDGMPWKALQRLWLLKVGGFEKLVTLPKGLEHIPQLRELQIEDCKPLRSCFPLSELNEAGVRPIEEAKSFQTLSSLLIVNCPEIKYLSSGLRHLVGLRSLEISGCSEELDCLYKEEDNGMPWKAMQRLDSLVIEGFENLVALPKGLQHLSSLSVLVIRNCKTLEGVLPDLPQLKELYVRSCLRFSVERIRDEHPNLVVDEG